MKRVTFVPALILSASLLLFGCSSNSSAPSGGTPTGSEPACLSAYTVGDTCAAGAKRSAEKDSVGIEVVGKEIRLYHLGSFNCCMDSARLELAHSGQVLNLLEVEYTSQPCRCTCSFKITADIPVESPGEYTLRIEQTNALWGESDTTLSWEGAVTIPGSP
jgi:hypothetical protein